MQFTQRSSLCEPSFLMRTSLILASGSDKAEAICGAVLVLWAEVMHRERERGRQEERDTK